MEIRFKNLIKEYENKGTVKRVLNIQSGEIKESSITAIIGANGAGKSTLINILAGLDTKTEGKIDYIKNGEIKNSLNKAKITMVFQTPYLLRTTVEKNIAYPLKLRKVSSEEIEARTAELMEELGLTALRKQKAWKLSGGEVQKVALARALSFKPEVLLLDEPTANIDPATTAEIEKILLKINKNHGTTIVIITHNLAQAKRLCSDVIFLNKGELIEAGDCRQVLGNPKNDITGRFVAGELIL